jgi:hypothetical protein
MNTLIANAIISPVTTGVFGIHAEDANRSHVATIDAFTAIHLNQALSWETLP